MERQTACKAWITMAVMQKGISEVRGQMTKRRQMYEGLMRQSLLAGQPVNMNPAEDKEESEGEDEGEDGEAAQQDRTVEEASIEMVDQESEAHTS